MQTIDALIAQVLQPAGVQDERIFSAMRKVPKVPFLLPEYRDLAYADAPVPIGKGQVMNASRDLALALQALGIESHERVLEVGTGSGYWTAVLAQLAQEVISVEIEPDLKQRAAAVLREQDLLHTVVLEEGNAARGWMEGAPYDAILVTGSLPLVSVEWLSQLNEGGRLWAVVGNQLPMQAQCWTCVGTNQWNKQVMFETYWPALQGCAHEVPFSL